MARLLGPVDSGRTFATCILLVLLGMLSPLVTGTELSALAASTGVLPVCRG